MKNKLGDLINSDMRWADISEKDVGDQVMLEVRE